MPFPAASSVLEGITVLDLTRVRAGPTCTRQLGDWGAEVIKVEFPESLSHLDHLTKNREGSDFINLHRNKRSLTVNLKAPEGLALFKKQKNRGGQLEHRVQLTSPGCEAQARH